MGSGAELHAARTRCETLRAAVAARQSRGGAACAWYACLQPSHNFVRACQVSFHSHDEKVSNESVIMMIPLSLPSP